MTDHHDCSVPGCSLSTLVELCPTHRDELHSTLRSIVSGGLIRERVHQVAPILGEEQPARVERDERPGLWEELQTTIARLSKSAGGGGAKSSDQQLSWNDKASATASQLGNAVTTWARLIDEEHDHVSCRAASVPAAADWLASLVRLIAAHHDAPAMLADMTRWTAAARRVIDSRPDRMYAGMCETPVTLADVAAQVAVETGSDPEAKPELCHAELYTLREEPVYGCTECGAVGRKPECPRCHEPRPAVIVCSECGHWHDVAYRQRWMSEHLADQLVTAGDAAPWLSWVLGKEVKVNTIINWRHRGLLAAVDLGEGEEEDPRLGKKLRFRFSDIEALATELRTRDTQPRAKKGSAA